MQALTTFGCGHSGGVHLFPFRTEKPQACQRRWYSEGNLRESRSPPNCSRPEACFGPFFWGYDRRVELRDQDLLLRPPTEADVPAVTAACQDEELARFLPRFPSLYRDQDARDWIASRNTGDLGTDFLIVDAAEGDLLGCDPRPASTRSGRSATGSQGGSRARGRDSGDETSSRWALTEGGVERLELTTAPDNVASQRVAEKAGFTREGVLRAHTASLRGAGLGHVLAASRRSRLGCPQFVAPLGVLGRAGAGRARRAGDALRTWPRCLLGERIHGVERLRGRAGAELAERAARLQPEQPVGEAVRRFADLSGCGPQRTPRLGESIRCVKAGDRPK